MTFFRKQPAALKVLVVGQTPPPHGGQAIMIERLLRARLPGVQWIHVRMGFSSHMSELGRIRPAKILHLLLLIVRIAYRRVVDRPQVLYYPPAGPDRVPVVRDVVVLLATRWMFDQVVFHFHAGGVSALDAQLPRWQRWLFRRAYFHADLAIRPSQHNPEDGRRLRARRDVVIPCGIDDPRPGLVVPPAADALRADRDLRLLFAGILRESKGVLVLIEACGRLAARGIPFHLELMGQWQSDSFAERTRQRIVQLGLERQVHFLGVLEGAEKFAAFQRADVLCLPTFFNCETFGLVLIEAMACGLPTVATRWRGLESVVDDGVTGLLVEPRDAAALAERLAVLAGDADLRARLGAAGRARFEREFTFARHAERMRQALLQVAGRVGAPVIPTQSAGPVDAGSPSGELLRELIS